MKIEFLKLLDRFVGISATWLLASPSKKSFKSPESILLIRPGGIGDAVLVMPAIDILRKTFPHCSIDILSEKRNSKIFSLSPLIRRIFHYDNLKELLQVMLRSYDVVLDTEQWHRLSAVVARLTRAGASIGFGTNERKNLFTDPQPYSHDDYEVLSFLRLLNPLIKEHIRFDPELPFLEIPYPLTEKARSILRGLPGTRFIAIFPGSSIEERKWGRERFHQTASLLSKQGYAIAVLGGNEDIREGETIARNLSGSMNFCGKFSLPETAAILKEASLLITGDSGIMHIGHGLGIPIVALFGPGREKKWAPRGKNCRIINKRLECSPCTTFGYTPKCKRNIECMKRITAEEVVQKALELLEG